MSMIHQTVVNVQYALMAVVGAFTLTIIGWVIKAERDRRDT